MSGARTLWDDGQTGAIKISKEEVSADISNMIYSTFRIVNLTWTINFS